MRLKVESLDHPASLTAFSQERIYRSRAPPAHRCGANHPVAVAGRAAGSLPLTKIFQPALANLAKAIVLCRNNARLTTALQADRNDARPKLAVALAQSERERAFLSSLYDAIPDLVWSRT